MAKTEKRHGNGINETLISEISNNSFMKYCAVSLATITVLQVLLHTGSRCYDLACTQWNTYFWNFEQCIFKIFYW